MQQQYESRWGETPETMEEHVHMIMGRYLETGSLYQCFFPKIGIFPYAKYLEAVLKEQNWEKLNNLIYQENCVRSFEALTNGETHYWAFLDMLAALATSNLKIFELLLPRKMEKVTNIFSLYKPATNMLIGLWYHDEDVLKDTIPKAKKFVNGKRPQWERAIVAYLLALYEKNPKEAQEQLQRLCKTAMRSDIADKILFVPAHGLYQLASYVWNQELFHQLAMPDHKSFSKEYAIWRNTQSIQPKLFITYPDSKINQMLIDPSDEIIALGEIDY